MKDTALYEHLLGLKTPWSVKKVDLSLADQRVVVEVVLKKGQVWADPTDATKRAHINGWTEREWRHLDIVHDKFHISKYLGEAVDTVRKQEHRRLMRAGASPLTGSKWAWLKSYPDGRSAEAVSFRALNQLNLKTSRAWTIKENFTQFWSYSYKGSAKRFFDAWSNNAMRSRLKPIKKVVTWLALYQGDVVLPVVADVASVGDARMPSHDGVIAGNLHPVGV